MVSIPKGLKEIFGRIKRISPVERCSPVWFRLSFLSREILSILSNPQSDRCPTVEEIKPAVRHWAGINLRQGTRIQFHLRFIELNFCRKFITFNYVGLEIQQPK